MNTRTKRALALFALSTTALLASVVAPWRAEAECVEADVYVTRTSAPRQYVVGPDWCAAPTPWRQGLHVYAEERRTGLPPGSPDGAGFNVWVPAP